MPADDLTKNKDSSLLTDEKTTVPSERASQDNAISSAREASTETAAGDDVSSEDSLESVPTSAAVVIESDGKTSETVPPLLAKFDALHFKNSFLETVEEVRMRRTVDAENEERIKQLVTENHDLQQKLEEERTRCSNLIEGHSHQEQELRKEYEEKLKHVEVEKAKNNLSSDCWEQELKALKDEIRTLHLAKYTLEKKVQEQERQLHVQNSSRDTYLSKINQLEGDCASLSSKVETVLEHMERLEGNVKGAKELHKKLEYVNEHQKCELEQCRRQLENCRGELVGARVELAALHGGERGRNGVTEELAAKMRSAEQELKMQVEINRQVQSQLLKVREEHRAVLQQLKEAHTLTERHVESSAKLGASEMLMQEEVSNMRVKMKESEKKLLSSTSAYQSLEERFKQETEEHKKKHDDVEHRLKTLQSDYNALQESYDALSESKSTMEREMKNNVDEMIAEKERLQECLKNAQEVAEKMKLSQEQRWSEKVEQFRTALEQSEEVLAGKERSLEEKTKECAQFEDRLKEQRQFLDTVTHGNSSDPGPPEQLENQHQQRKPKKPSSETEKGKHGESLVTTDTHRQNSDDHVTLSPDLLPVSSQKNNHESEKNVVEVVVCTTSNSKMSENKKVSPKLCLQRLPLPLQMKPPVQKRAREPTPVQETNVISVDISGDSKVLEDCESPQKKIKIIEDSSKENKASSSSQHSNHSQVDVPVKERVMQTTDSNTNKHVIIEPNSSEVLSDDIPQTSDTTEDSRQFENVTEPKNDVSESSKDVVNNTKLERISSKTKDEQQQSCSSVMMDQQPNPLSVEFSEDEDDEVLGDDFLMDGGEMVNTQISKQIDKVQSFLKMDRLRRPRKQ